VAFLVYGGVFLVRSNRILILMLLVVAACTKAVPRQVVRVAPATPPPPLSHIEQHVEPLVAAIPAELPQISVNDPIDLKILEARLHFERGENLYKQGFLRGAKEEFDRAVDLILDAAQAFPKDARLQRELTDLTARVNAMELAALRQGDGFTDQKEERAAIDDLVHVETFPALIDPKLKKEVEEDVKETSHDLPIEINDRVLGFLDYYQNGRGRGAIEVGLQRAGRYQPMIEKVLKEEGVPLDLMYLCQAESAFQPRAVSRAQAKGMWQFISSRGKEYGLRQTWWIDERSDPEKSTRAAARHLKDLYQEFGDWCSQWRRITAGRCVCIARWKRQAPTTSGLWQRRRRCHGRLLITFPPSWRSPSSARIPKSMDSRSRRLPHWKPNECGSIRLRIFESLLRLSICQWKSCGN